MEQRAPPCSENVSEQETAGRDPGCKVAFFPFGFVSEPDSRFSVITCFKLLFCAGAWRLGRTTETETLREH